MKLLLYSFILLFLFSCNTSKKDWDNIKSSTSVSDFSSFVINHPSSKFINKAIKRQIVLRDSLIDVGNLIIPPCMRFNASLFLINSDSVLFHHEPIKIDDLENKVYDYFLSKNVNSSRYQFEIDGFDKKVLFSTGHIEFAIDSLNFKGTPYHKSINQVVKGLKKYETYLIEEILHKKVNDLNKTQRRGIDELTSYKLSFYKPFFNPVTNPLPPPPPPAPLP